METNPMLERPVYSFITVGEAQRLLGMAATIQQLQHDSSPSPEVTYLPPRMTLSDQEGSTFDYDVILGEVLRRDSHGTLLSGRLTPKPGNRHAGVAEQDTEYTVNIARVGRVGRFGQWLLYKTGINMGWHTVDVTIEHANGYDKQLRPVSSNDTA